MPETIRFLSETLRKNEVQLLTDWIAEQTSALEGRADLIKEAELKVQGKEFWEALRYALQSGNCTDIQSQEWESVRDILSNVSRARASQGFTPSETANFVFALKKPLFTRLQQVMYADPAALAEELWATTNSWIS